MHPLISPESHCLPVKESTIVHSKNIDSAVTDSVEIPTAHGDLILPLRYSLGCSCKSSIFSAIAAFSPPPVELNAGPLLLVPGEPFSFAELLHDDDGRETGGVDVSRSCEGLRVLFQGLLELVLLGLRRSLSSDLPLAEAELVATESVLGDEAEDVWQSLGERRRSWLLVVEVLRRPSF